MGFYDLDKEQRDTLVNRINNELFEELNKGIIDKTTIYFSDTDTYIRKTAYMAIGKIFKANKALHRKVVSMLDMLFLSENFYIRQTVINSCGEIGLTDFAIVEPLLEKGLYDPHHSVRNAVIGALKKIIEKNPEPSLVFARKYLHHEDKEIRREICHGLELRGRKYPQDVLPLLKELQDEKTSRVRNMLIHVIGQIAYKKGCLATVAGELKSWYNKALVKQAVEEIISVHESYKNFAAMTQEEAVSYLNTIFPKT